MYVVIEQPFLVDLYVHTYRGKGCMYVRTYASHLNEWVAQWLTLCSGVIVYVRTLLS